MEHSWIDSIPVARATYESALQQVAVWIDEGHQTARNRYVCFLEANLLSQAMTKKEVAEVLRRSDMVLGDGVAIGILARLAGRSLPQRLPGPTFILRACSHGLRHGWRHFFYGGAPGVAQKLADELRAQCDGIQIAGVYSPPFRPLTPEEDANVAAMIDAANPDLLWVGLGGPKQELWMAQHIGGLKVPVMLGVGAAFDFHSKSRPWAPAWIRRIGMEWLFRALSGGRRTLFRNLRCVSLVALYLLVQAAKWPLRSLGLLRRKRP